MQKNARPLSLFDLTCMGVNTIIGSSIFLFPGKVTALLGPASLVAFVLVGFLLFSVGLCFAEAATYFSGPGGAYLYTTKAFGKRTGYAVGWMSWLSQVMSWGAVANGVSSYLSTFDPIFSQTWIIKAVALTIIISLGTLNFRGTKMGAWTSNVFTLAKLLPLIVVVVFGSFHINPSHFTPFAPHGWNSMGAGAFMIYFAYQGFENISAPAGEAIDPHKNISKAVIFSFLIAMFFYLWIQFVALGVEPNLASSPRPLALVASQIFGPTGALLISIGAVISMVGYNSSTALSNPRYLVALAEDGHLPSPLKRFHAKFGTPHVAVATTSVVACLLALFLDFKTLVDFSNVVTSVQYALTCAAVLKLRRDFNRVVASWKRFVPHVGITATLWLGSQATSREIFVAALLVALGFCIKPTLNCLKSFALKYTTLEPASSSQEFGT